LSKDGNCIYTTDGTCFRWNGTTYVQETMLTGLTGAVSDYYIEDSDNSDLVILHDENINILFIIRRDSSGVWNSEYSMAVSIPSTYNKQNSFRISGNGTRVIVKGNPITVLTYNGSSWVSTNGPEPFRNYSSQSVWAISHSGNRIIAYDYWVYDYNTLTSNWNFVELVGAEYHDVDAGDLKALSQYLNSSTSSYVRIFNFFTGSDTDIVGNLRHNGYHSSVININVPLNSPKIYSLSPKSYIVNLIPISYNDRVSIKLAENIKWDGIESYKLYDFYFNDTLMYKKYERCVIYNEDNAYILCTVYSNANNILTVFVNDVVHIQDGNNPPVPFIPTWSTYSIMPY
jgi:hypothetical protein